MDDVHRRISAAPRRWVLPWPVALLLPVILALVLCTMLLGEPQRAAGATDADGSASRMLAPGQWIGLTGDNSWVLTVSDQHGPTMNVLVGHDDGRQACPVVDDTGTVGGGTWINLRPADGATASPAADAGGCGLLAETVDNDLTGLITTVLSNGAMISMTSEGN